MKWNVKQEKIVTICVLAAVFAICGLVCRPVFYLNDDVTIRSILSGSYTGTPDGHAVYMKYPLTLILSIFYRVAGCVCWLELFFAGCLVWSVTEIVGVIRSRKREYFWEMTAGILFVVPFFWYMHYTVIAAVLAATSVFLVCVEKKGIKPVFCWFCSWMIRSQVAWLSLPFLGVALLWKLIGGDLTDEKKNRRETACGMLKTVLIGAVGLGICMGINNLAYSGDEWQAYLKYNGARTELYDYTNFHSSGHYSENYEHYGMTEEEFVILDSYNTMLDASLDGEKMEMIAEKVTASMENDRDGAAWIKECIRQYYYQIRYADQLYGILWLAMFGVLVVLLLLGRSWPGVLLAGCLGVGRSLIWIFLIYRGRFPERISVSLYIIEMLLLAGMLCSLPAVCRKNLEDLRQKLSVRLKSLNRAVIICSTVLVIGAACILTEQIRSDAPVTLEQAAVQKEWNVLKEHCEENEEILYLLDVFSAVEYGGFQYERDAENIMLAGGWMSASPLVSERFADRNVSDGAQALYESNNTVFLAEKGKSVEWLEQYLTKRFGQCSLESEREIVCSADKVFAEYKVVK